MRFPDCSPFKGLKVNENRRLFINPPYFMNKWIKEHDPSHLVVDNRVLLNQETESLLQYHNFTEVIISNDILNERNCI